MTADGRAAVIAILGFAVTALAVVLAGVRLARYGDVIAGRTRLGALWTGSMFLALATSLPELATDVAAIRLGAADLAAGDLFGSSMANMLILALVGAVSGGELFRRVALENGLSASLAIGLTATAALLMLTRLEISLFGIGYGSLIVAIGYGLGMRTIYRSSSLPRPEADSQKAGPQTPSLERAVVGFSLASLVVLIAAPLFAASAKRLAELTGLAQSFVGTWLVGFATSLPELVTTLAAVRLKAYDLAVGNLFGSNALNMALVLPLDLAHTGAPFLASVSQVHVLSALVAILLMGIALMAIVSRSQAGRGRLEPASALMILVYVAGMGLVYLFSGE